MKPIALVTSDSNPDYTQFEVIVKEFWTKLGFEPIYLKVGVDYPEIKNVPTSLQAQILRLYAPSDYPDRMVLLSDMDMLPLCSKYFMSKLPQEEGQFSIYSSDAYTTKRYPMCYIASYGQNYNIFKSSDDETWEDFVLRLNNLNYGWDTDELYMSDVLSKSSFELLEHNRGWVNGIASKRFDRVHWDPNLDEYVDAHCPRPYSRYKSIIDSLKDFVS